MKQEAVSKQVQQIATAKGVYNLFKLLGYPEDVLPNVIAPREKELFDFQKEDTTRIEKVYSVVSFGGDLQVYLLETKTLSDSFIRSVTMTLDRQYEELLLIFMIDYSEIVFIVPSRMQIEDRKHKLRLNRLIILKDQINYKDIEVFSTFAYEKGDNHQKIWGKIQVAFNSEAMTNAFFEDYKKVFFTLRNDLMAREVPPKDAHEFTLTFLNRLLFTYFIFNKRGLNTPKFVAWLWRLYNDQGLFGQDQFYSKWLIQVFFKAFTNHQEEITDLPEEVVKKIAKFPFLNGQLFKQTPLDGAVTTVTDEMCDAAISCFEKYNFTIWEDTPLDQNVAVNPQIIGYVNESLANVVEDINDRNSLGIFYTPRVEVDFMCRRAVVEYLAKHLPVEGSKEKVPKEKIYHLVFDPPEENGDIKEWWATADLWRDLEVVLDNLSVVDPACGSGAFLIGMLVVLSDLYKLVNKHLARQIPDFDLKTKIIQRCLHGVDVMPWAIHAAKLRLWLQLIAETDLDAKPPNQNPLLPDLNLNLRIGDALVQEIGGVHFNIRTNALDAKLKQELKELKQEKQKYFENAPAAKFQSPEAVKEEEAKLFGEIINWRIASCSRERDDLYSITKSPATQSPEAGAKTGDLKFLQGETETNNKRNKQIKKLEEQIAELQKTKDVLKLPGTHPFVWEICFAEIFGEKNGFDIVIGNPPYVRQEMISPANRTKAQITHEDKQLYKKKLSESVHNKFRVIGKINPHSDYYIYFYFHGLSLLNNHGILCFITSNSWLDVGYGKDLQGFLLKYVPMVAFYDNPKRTFSRAGINTVISLFGAPILPDASQPEWVAKEKIRFPMQDNIFRFVMFHKPFEEVINAQNLVKIEASPYEDRGAKFTDQVHNITNTEGYRVFPVKQEFILEDQWDYPDDYNPCEGKFRTGEYGGDTWGGKYLRAPNIFYTVLEKGAQKFVDLTEIAEIRRGFTTGSNEFFYFTPEKQEQWQIEPEFIKPVIKSPKECKTIEIFESALYRSAFLCNKSKDELSDTNALAYIEWGEKQHFEEGSTVSARNLWYNLDSNEEFDLIIPRSFDTRYICHYGSVNHSDRFYGIKAREKKALCVYLNSSVFILMTESLAKQGLGYGAIDLNIRELNRIPILIVAKVKDFQKIINHSPKTVFDELGMDRTTPFKEQVPNPVSERKAIDDLIFDAIQLSDEERTEVYRWVCEMIDIRKKRAESLGIAKKKLRKRG